MIVLIIVFIMDDKKKLINLVDDLPLSNDEDETLKKPKPSLPTSQYEGEPEAPRTSQSQPVFENGTFGNSEDVPPLLVNVEEEHSSTEAPNVRYRINMRKTIILWFFGGDSYCR